jgi:RNA polymerase sigma factor (sigma-70 family)
MDSAEELSLLIESCNKGDRKSQQVIYQMFYGKMMATCLRYTKNKAEAKDILQDGFIKMFNSLGKYNFQGSFEGWVRRIIVNTAIDSYRKKSSLLINENVKFVEQIQDVVEEEIDENISLPNNYKIADIIEAMQELSPAYKMVFNLYIMEDHSHKQIADLLGINEGTSKSNLAKAKQNIIKILEKNYTKKNND